MCTLPNLAGDQNADKHIATELRRCRVPIHIMQPLPGRGYEVPWTIYGTLGGFTFIRRGNYWEAKGGKLSLPQAETLYADPVGKTDIKVNGNGDAPAPTAPVLRYCITTEVGLRVFADYLRACVLATT